MQLKSHITLEQLRGTLFREYTLAGIAVNDAYHNAVTEIGISHKQTEEDVMGDILYGIYDDGIEGAIDVLLYAKESHGNEGYIINGHVWHDEDIALKALNDACPNGFRRMFIALADYD